MLALYNALLTPLRPVAWMLSGWDRVTGGARRAEWSERRATRLPCPLSRSVWIHGSSVGEVRLVTALAERLRAHRPDRPLAVSAVTPAGRGRLPEPPAVNAAFFAPLDFRGLASRLLERIDPSVLALVETELWPNLITEAAGHGTRVVILNGRLSERRMRRYRRWHALYARLLEKVEGVGAQSDEDAERFVELGLPASRVRVTGNAKYDLPVPDGTAEGWRRRIGIDPGRPVLVAGSTGEGEELAVARAVRASRARFPDLLTLYAPRHLERLGRVEGELSELGERTGRLSALPGADGLDAVLVDTIGSLASLYRVGTVAFVGGSLVPVGGHNLLEPAAVDVPVIFGPHVDHVAPMARSLTDSAAAIQVATPEELSDALTRLLESEEERARLSARAATALATHRGALAQSMEIIG